MKTVMLLVEGETEERFVRRLLDPLFSSLVMKPVVVKTNRSGARPKLGGTVSYRDFKKQLYELLRNPTVSLVTTMLDYQGLPRDFPGRSAPEGNSPLQRVLFIEHCMKADIADERYEPYLALHEFEAMLFANPEAIAEVLQRPILDKPLMAIQRQKAPEEINDSPATSPSARIKQLCRDYCGSEKVFQKSTHGILVAERIGLTAIRAACPHFDAWLRKLEALAASAT